MKEILKRNEELYNDFYERTKNYGRSQFVKFILAEEEEKRLLNNKNTKLLNINKKLEQENNQIKKDLEFVLEQILGAFIKNWCIDWNFIDIREKYKISDDYEWNGEVDE